MTKRTSGSARDLRRRGYAEAATVIIADEPTGPSRRCVATNKYGEPCGNYRTRGTDLCAYHSSSWPAHALWREWRAAGGAKDDFPGFQAWALERGFIVGGKAEIQGDALTSAVLAYQGWLR